MARLIAFVRQWLLPHTLFGRLASLLLVAVLASHMLALTLMFELGPGERPEPPARRDVMAELLFLDEPQPAPGPPPDPLSLLHPGFWIDVGVRLAALMLVAWFGARWLSQPVQRLASAARELGQNIHRPPLPEEGTDECREATRVINQMQAQICRQLSERDSFVAAVSHDLRTPLTRLALRVGSLPDEDQRQRFGQDITEMSTMITATLDYLRGVADPEPLVNLDIVSLLHSIADDHAANGHDVQVLHNASDTPCAPLPTQASALRRCLHNLVDNAVRYGHGARIRCLDTPAELRIEIQDQGPGIAAAELDKVLTPFYRLEASRNRHSGGVGLGLSIAHSIVQGLHGSLHLSNPASGGLLATVTLPR